MAAELQAYAAELSMTPDQVVFFRRFRASGQRSTAAMTIWSLLLASAAKYYSKLLPDFVVFQVSQSVRPRCSLLLCWLVAVDACYVCLSTPRLQTQCPKTRGTRGVCLRVWVAALTALSSTCHHHHYPHRHHHQTCTAATNSTRQPSSHTASDTTGNRAVVVGRQKC